MLWWWMLACGGPPEPARTPEEAVAEWSVPGPFRAGYRETSLTYDAVDAPGRALRLALWYPTLAESGPEVQYRDVFPAPGVLGEVAPAPGPFGLVVFSHGHQGFAENSGALCALLATHGWVVAAPDHTGNTLVDGADRDTPLYVHRITDLSAVLDHLEGPDPLSPHVSGPIAGFGHSFGGYTLHAAGGARFDPNRIAACLDGSGEGPFCASMDATWAARFEAGLREPRLEALVSMAPGDYGQFGAGLAEMEVPTLQMTGGLDSAVGDGLPIWEAMDHPGDLRVFLPRASHNTFTDFAGRVGAVEGELEGPEAHRILGVYTLAFLEARLLADPAGGAVLAGAVEVSAEAERVGR